ncbi:hypothetical protein F7Q95_16960 [Pseudomonas psychrophila]|nr:hypothetical protein F7Q95_16960 [Pseudomonas psychrophila]
MPGVFVCLRFESVPRTCGSGLARDASCAIFQLNRSAAIASKPAPTRCVCGQANIPHPQLVLRTSNFYTCNFPVILMTCSADHSNNFQTT